MRSAAFQTRRPPPYGLCAVVVAWIGLALWSGVHGAVRARGPAYAVLLGLECGALTVAVRGLWQRRRFGAWWMAAAFAGDTAVSWLTGDGTLWTTAIAAGLVALAFNELPRPRSGDGDRGQS